MNRNRHRLAVCMLLGFFRDDLDYAALKVHVLPLEVAAVAKAQPGVDAGHDEQLPLRTLLRRLHVELFDLVDGEFPAAEAVVGEQSDAVPRVVHQPGLVSQQLEHLAERTDMPVVGACRVVAAVLRQILGDGDVRHVAKVGNLDVVLLDPAGEPHPCHALGVHGGLGNVFPLGRHLVVVPDLGEREFPAAESERGEESVEHPLRLRPVSCPSRAAVPLSVYAHAEGVAPRLFPLQASCSFLPSHLVSPFL